MRIEDMFGRLLAASTDLAARGEDWAAERMGVSDDPDDRKAMLRGMGAGAAAAGALALILGTRTGRRVGGRAVQIGALAGLGALGWRAYQQWRETQGDAETAPPPRLEGPAAEARARMLIAAMVSAAKADGHFDAAEREAVRLQIAGALEDDADQAVIDAELERPADPTAIAALADGDPAAAREIYLVSALTCEETSAAERAYLDALAAALSLEPGLALELEREARAAG